MTDPSFHFADKLSPGDFLDHYWQQRPVLLRGAIDPAACRLSPDELAGLACEETVESRLIQQRADSDWQLRHGPLDETDFAGLPGSHWTLLVQDVDKYVPEVAAMLDAFDFLPDWRLDDIMVSYAVDQGGVGPHTDNYDVFLIQAHGKRRWRLSFRDYTESDLLPDCPLRVLQHFDTDEDWLLEPGDVLYLPPGLAHWGTAVGECMTWSVGMRGASDTELASAWLEQLPLHEGRHHLTDHVDSSTHNPSRLGERDFAQACDTIRRTAPQDSPAFRLWLGRHLTEPKPGFEIAEEGPPHPRLLAQWFADELAFQHHPWARFANARIDPQRIALFAQGAAMELAMQAEAIVEAICRHPPPPARAIPGLRHPPARGHPGRTAAARLDSP